MVLCGGDMGGEGVRNTGQVEDAEVFFSFNPDKHEMTTPGHTFEGAWLRRNNTQLIEEQKPC